jgi:hypothetical protein
MSEQLPVIIDRTTKIMLGSCSQRCQSPRGTNLACMKLSHAKPDELSFVHTRKQT